MNLADNLRKIRKDNNLSQEQLAEKLGVSRQSVSKWESNQAYPEMDKVIQICQMFNLNVDELLNQDLKEVKEKKESKNNLNKFIDDALNFITKTVDMFSSMKFKERIKCLIEQLIIILLIILLFSMIDSLCSFILNNLLGKLPYDAYNFIYSILQALYVILSTIAGIVIFFHIFKTRYLDYYVIVKNEEDITTKKIESVKEENKTYLEKNKEKIIIRDPKHSEYKFISSLFKCALFIIKVFLAFFAFDLLLTLISFIICIVMSFLFIKTGVIFIGIVLSLAASIIVILILLYIIYNFILNKKIQKSKSAITFIISIIIFSIGLGLFIIGLKDFNYIEDINHKYYLNTETTLDMNDKLLFDNYFDIEYIESDNTDIKIVCRHSKYYTCSINNSNDIIYIHTYMIENKLMDQIRDNIESINNKEIVDYSKTKIYVYTTKENIDILKRNKTKYEEDNDYYDRRIRELEDELYRKNQDINELKEKIKTYESN